MLLKGLIPNQDVCVEFTLSDCPVVVSGTLMAITGRRLSPLIQIASIVRGDLELGLFEGDKLYNGEDELGQVVYVQGFKLLKLDMTVEKLPNLKHIQVVKGNRESLLQVCSFKDRTPLQLVYNNELSSLERLVEKTKDGQYALLNTRRLVDEYEFNLYTGYTDNTDIHIRFNQIYNGGVVCLHNGDVCIDYGDSIYEPI